MARDIGFTITVKGTEQQLKKIGELDQSLKRLATQRAELLKKVKDGIMLSKEEQVALGKLTVESKKLQAQKSKTLAQIKTENELVKSTAGSYNRLVLENKKLTDAARRLSDPLGKNKKRFQELSSQINTNTGRLKKMDAAMGRSFRNVGNYSGAIGRLRGGFVAMGAAIAAGIVAFRAFTRLVGGSISTLVEFDEAMADTQKTTGLTADAVARLTEELKKLDTPTSINGLLAIAEAGGRLGVADDELLGFVETVDKVVVALGDVLGTDPEAIGRSLGKVASLFKVDEAFGIAEGINKIGSALNELGAQTKATEPFLIDFALRLGGIAPLAEIAIEDVLGLAATLDELGQPAETSATAIGNLLLKLGSELPTFAEIAGVSIDDFSTILREDANEALILVLEQVGKTGKGLENLAGVLEDAGIEGRRAAQIVGVLSNNTELLRKNQDLATESFAAGTSLTEEFNLKSATLGATWAKLVKVFSNRALSTGLVNFLTSVVKVITPVESLSSEINKLTKETEDNEKEILALVEQYEELNLITDPTVQQQIELNKVISSLGKRVPEAATEFDKYGNIIAISTEQIIKNLEAERENTEFRRDKAIATLRRATEARNADNQAIQEDIKELEALNDLERDEEKLLKVRREQLNLNALATRKAAIELRGLGAAISDEQLALLAANNEIIVKNESTEELIRLSRQLSNVEEAASIELNQRVKQEIKLRFEALEGIKEVAEEEKEVAFVTKKEREALAKQIAKNNATILALNRELIEETIKLNSEGNAQQQSLLEESHRQEIEDLEAQKGEVVAINDAIDDLIEAKEKSHQAEITAIQQDGIDEQNNNRMLALDLEQQQALTAVAESEDTEKEKQQAILDIQIEFAEKRLRLLEETGDLADAQVRLQIEQLKTTLAELRAEDEEPTGLASFFNITEEEAEFIRARAMEVAQQISDAIFTIQQRNDKRRTDARLKAVDEESKAELSILQDKLDNGIISQEEFDNQRVQLEDKADRKTEAIERKAFNRNKVLSLVQVGVDTASAIVKAIAQFGPPPSPAGIAAIASALLIGGTQALVIGSQKFKEGGELVGPSHEQGGIKSGGVEFEGGEGVINKRSMRSGDVLSVSGTPRDIASQINSYKGFGVPFGGTTRKFQLGGVAPAPNIAPQGAGSIAAISAGVSLEDVAELIIEAQNAQVIQVVETDITDTQNDVSVIEALQA